MGLGLSNLCYKTFKKQIFPFFLDMSFENELSLAIQIFEENLGKRIEEVPLQLIENLFDDRRIGRGIIHALLKIYRLEKPDILKNVRQETIAVLKSKKIDSPADLRQLLFEWINKRYGGFVPSHMRTTALKEFSEEMGIPIEDLEKILWADEDTNLVLTRDEKKPTVLDLIGVYNFEAIETLVSNSKSISLAVESKELGRIARIAIKLAKRYSVLCDLFVRGQAVEIKYYGPRELFGRATRFGKPLSYALFSTFSVCEKMKANILRLHMDLVIGKKQYFYEADRRTLPYIKVPEKYAVKESMFDSQVEKQFYWAFHANKPKGWTIIREPMPLVFEGMMIVPDFLLQRDNKRVFVEIIGFWRREYLSKKTAQIDLLRKNGVPIILLVNNKYADLFNKVGVPVFSYTRRGNKVEIPYGSIVRYLEKL
ncbi:MAG: DUF790 family protein [Candidatus Baldrarchaeia archaeon]